MTLAELRQVVRNNLQEPDENGRFPNSILNALINEACFEIADRLEALVWDALAEVSPETAIIDLPETALGIKRVQWNDKVLAQTTQRHLDTISSGWTELIGVPERYYTSSPTMIRLVPIPADYGIVRIQYVSKPATLVYDEDVSDLPSFLVDLAPLFATYRAHLSDADGERRASTWLQLFENRISLAQRSLARRQTVPSGFRIRPECRR